MLHRPVIPRVSDKGAIRALDDLHGPVSNLRQCTLKLGSGIAAVGEDMAQPGEGIADRLEDQGRAVAVLDIGAMDDQSDQQTERIGDDMALELRSLLRSP